MLFWPFLFLKQNLRRNESLHGSYGGADISHHHADKFNTHYSSQPPTTSYSSPDRSNDLHQFPPTNRPEYSAYPQHYDHQSYPNEQQPTAHTYQFSETPNPSFSYPNFQSYPSFHDSSFPATPTHQPSYNHGPDIAYTHQPAASFPSYPSAAQFSGSSNVNHAVSQAPPAENYKYDCNYQPTIEKIAEAHKAARFAVGALAFDDVPVAVDFLRRSLELLTNPSAETH